MGKPDVGEARSVTVEAREILGIPVSMGNPHFVVFVETFPEDWQQRSAAIQRDASFPKGVNVEFVRVIARDRIEVRFYERGVGETLSSGTGSSAAAAAAIATKQVKSPVHVDAAGGTQVVRWPDDLYLRGSADLICRGEFFE
jgi:diaminopimelate epimerase